MKKWFAVILLLVFAVSVALPAFAADPVLINSLSLDKETAVVAIGKTVTLKATIDPKNATNKKLEWISSDENIATVKNGTVKGIAEGTAVITVKALDESGATASATVSVVKPVKKITLSDKSISVPVNYSYNLKVTVDPADATNKGLKFISSDEKVVTVDAEGLVLGVSKGNAKITIEALDGSNVKAVIPVKVEEFDLLFDTTDSQSIAFEYSGGKVRIKANAKNGCVEIPNSDRSVLAIGGNFTDFLAVNPIKSGADIITLNVGRNKKVYNVYVSPSAFDPYDMGIGIGCFFEGLKKGIFNGHVYELIDEKLSWDDAKKKCEEKGGHLVTITSRYEYKYVSMLNHQYKHLWIGLRRVPGTDEWEWVTDEEYKFSNWEKGRPYNGSDSYYDYDCVAINNYWQDLVVDDKEVEGYVCEWDSIDDPVLEKKVMEIASRPKPEKTTILGLTWGASLPEIQKIAADVGVELSNIRRYDTMLNAKANKPDKVGKIPVTYTTYYFAYPLGDDNRTIIEDDNSSVFYSIKLSYDTSEENIRKGLEEEFGVTDADRVGPKVWEKDNLKITLFSDYIEIVDKEIYSDVQDALYSRWLD